MKEYHKIQSVFKRDPETKFKTFLLGDYAEIEFEYLANNKWVWTEKVDGTNIRIHWDGEKVTFGGRTDRASIPAKLVEKLQELFPVEKFEGKDPMTLYGEGYGNRIQKVGVKYISNGVDFVLFDVMCGNWILKAEDVSEIANNFEIKRVPFVGTGTLDEAIEFVKSKPKSVWGDFVSEGIVLRPAVELKTRSGHRIITKLKVKDFESH